MRIRVSKMQNWNELLRLKWVVENPIPKLPRNKQRNWKRFLSWVAEHDNYEEELSNSINTNNEDKGEQDAELE